MLEIQLLSDSGAGIAARIEPPFSSSSTFGVLP
jgi:hypothetical protein